MSYGLHPYPQICYALDLDPQTCYAPHPNMQMCFATYLMDLNLLLRTTILYK